MLCIKYPPSMYSTGGFVVELDLLYKDNSCPACTACIQYLPYSKKPCGKISCCKISGLTKKCL